LKSYLNELNAQVEEQRGRLASVKQDQAAAARGRLTLLDARLECLLDTIPPEVQTEGLSIVAVQVTAASPVPGTLRYHRGARLGLSVFYLIYGKYASERGDALTVRPPGESFSPARTDKSDRACWSRVRCSGSRRVVVAASARPARGQAAVAGQTCG
jgi:hypothetical protein